MSQALLRHVQEKSNSIRKDIPDVQPGQRVKVHQKILETTKDGMKERIQKYEGLVIAVGSGAGADKTFTVRKISEGVGVEKIFPIHSKSIAKIEIVGNSKVRRSKLYFMRDRSGKSARLKEAKLLGIAAVPEVAEELSEEVLQEAVEAAKKAEAQKAAEATEPAEATAEAAEPSAKESEAKEESKE